MNKPITEITTYFSGTFFTTALKAYHGSGDDKARWRDLCHEALADVAKEMGYNLVPIADDEDPADTPDYPGEPLPTVVDTERMVRYVDDPDYRPTMVATDDRPADADVVMRG